MKLESYAYDYKEEDTLEDFPIIIKEYEDENGRRMILDTTAIMRYIIDKIEEGENLNKIAVAGQKAVSIGLAKLAVERESKQLVQLVECSITKQ